MHTSDATGTDLPDARMRQRPATAREADFLTAMLLEAVNGDRSCLTLEEILRTRSDRCCAPGTREILLADGLRRGR